MSTTSTRTAAKTSAERATGPDLTEFARQQLSMAIEATSVLYRAAEAVQQVQHQFTQRSALRYQQMADKLRSASTPAEMLAIQSSLFTAGIQEVTQYLQDMGAASMKIQGDVMRGGADQAPGATPAATAGAAAANPMLQAWQTMFNAPLNGATGAAASH